jgi:hypothetical protein
LDCGESQRRITALGRGVCVPANLLTYQKIIPRSSIWIPAQKASDPESQSGDALALSPQSKVSSAGQCRHASA